MVRLFEFKTSIIKRNVQSVVAQYCSIGYYDGFDTKAYTWDMASGMLSNPNQIDRIGDERTDSFNLVGLRWESENNFWNNVFKPYVFVSYIKFENKSIVIKEIVEKIEEDFDACCYYTIESNDLIVCLKAERYEDGYRNVKDYFRILKEKDSKNSIKSIYSICSIKQEILNNIQKGINNFQKDEKVNCIIRCIVNDWEKIESFKSDFEKKVLAKSYSYKEILGREDLVIELKDVISSDLFKEYATNGMLTHSGYNGVFYNAQTEILVNLEI